MNPELLALSILVLLFSVIVHEVMHGFIALQFGDHTAEDMGRLTFNPLPHIDPIWSVLVPLLSFYLFGAAFGAAKPVPINPLNFSDIKKGEFWVSVAGILSNLGLALIAGILFHILGNPSPQSILGGVLISFVTINSLLAVFNLLPVPPLDGSKVLMALLPYNLSREYQKLERFGFLLIFILILTPGLSNVVGELILSIVTSIRHLLLGL